MADLKCVVENCTYNKDCLCSKGDIMVGGKHACDCDGTCCESFAQKREGRESFSNSLSHPSHTISIDCEAVKCIYNSNYKCVAEHVDIKGCGACDCRETACATFRKVNHGKENQYSSLTNVPKLRIIKQVTGFGGRPPVHRFQNKIENKKYQKRG